MSERIKGEDIRVGDVIVFLGCDYLIDRIEPYVHPAFADEQWAIAYSGDWGITLPAGQGFDVRRFDMRERLREMSGDPARDAWVRAMHGDD